GSDDWRGHTARSARHHQAAFHEPRRSAATRATHQPGDERLGSRDGRRVGRPYCRYRRAAGSRRSDPVASSASGGSLAPARGPDGAVVFGPARVLPRNVRSIMKRGWISLVLTAALVAPMGASAQERSRPRAREEGPFRLFSFGAQRGRIGVVVNTAADVDKDKIGARVEAVTPNGPAAKAGLRADDIITKFGTTALAGVTTQDREESGPGMKLLELAREL